MLLEAIQHIPKSNYAYAYDADTLHIRVRTRRGDMDVVRLYYGDKYNWNEQSELVEMRLFASELLFDYYQVEIKRPSKRTAYCFQFSSKEKSIWYTERGFYEDQPDYFKGLFEFPFLNEIDVMKVPEWVKDAVFYQIFPERFANGDPSNDPEHVEEWGGKPHYDNFFGGDLQGVIDHLDYLVELGVNAIYFTPLFEATTNHKYDTVDYMKVDPHFGDNELLKRLVSLCHEKGIRVMLDAVFNHSGYYFAPFQDVVKHGASSKYADWFHVREFPIQTEPLPSYHTFAYTHMMPKLNTENPEVKEYLLSVAEYWIKEIGVDGWRLDVANEVDHQFWREFREVVKAANPEAYILGEVWHNSLPWLLGDQFDASMNYPVTTSILDFFCRQTIDAAKFCGQLDAMHASYFLQVNQVSFNLLDSHDTPRLLTICQEDQRKLRLAVSFQLTYMGTPCIYYGDEIGLTGEQDPDCRKTMIWEEEKQDRELFSFYQRMISIRRQYAALRTGSFAFLHGEQDGKLVAIERKNEKDHFILVFHAGDGEASLEVTDATSSTWECVYSCRSVTAQNHKLTVQLGAYDYLILRRRGDGHADS